MEPGIFDSGRAGQGRFTLSHVSRNSIRKNNPGFGGDSLESGHRRKQIEGTSQQCSEME